jgi:hypothetical protein
LTYVKWTLALLVLAVIAAFLHYVLPARDIVRVVGTEVRLETQTRTGPNGQQQIFQDDVYFIKTVEPDGSPSVYRNEDNAWYLKFDSANLDTQASNMVSTQDQPRWVVVTHYGWRIPLLSMYPNALSMRPAAGPGEELFPWNLVILAVLVVIVLFLWRIIRILSRRHVDPLVSRVEERFESRRGWWRRWSGRRS